ncbi:CatB-related O-acetyltransferase [Vibrio alginolyticus]|uniref:CatB-related O-acetyltransferase n=1 Tax=Vibrio alginolyticus TaxID=663 RepID=UPI001BD2C356|nr:CatB-related O-acetyltransferase [Vibrio alginolyticus]MBS9903566.1 CatB-related O-acetyltransferase [Vibrio alginolyticus]
MYKVKVGLGKENVKFSFQSYVDRYSNFGSNIRVVGRSNIHYSTVGDCSYIVNSRISRADIGKYCSIGSDSKVGGLGIHPTNYISTHPIFYSNKKQCGISFTDQSTIAEFERTIIGNDVWVGSNCIILDGVTIGDGSIIAAGSVVTKNVSPYAIVGGVPAKVIRYRFNEEDIETLLNIKWWDESIDRLQECTEVMEDNDVEKFVKRIRSLND